MSGTAINLTEMALQARIRDKLNQEGVKLWQAPFYNDTTKTVVDSEILVSFFANVTVHIVYCTIFKSLPISILY